MLINLHFHFSARLQYPNSNYNLNTISKDNNGIRGFSLSNMIFSTIVFLISYMLWLLPRQSIKNMIETHFIVMNHETMYQLPCTVDSCHIYLVAVDGVILVLIGFIQIRFACTHIKLGLMIPEDKCYCFLIRLCLQAMISTTTIHLTLGRNSLRCDKMVYYNYCLP